MSQGWKPWDALLRGAEINTNCRFVLIVLTPVHKNFFRRARFFRMLETMVSGNSCSRLSATAWRCKTFVIFHNWPAYSTARTPAILSSPKFWESFPASVWQTNPSSHRAGLAAQHDIRWRSRIEIKRQRRRSFRLRRAMQKRVQFQVRHVGCPNERGQIVHHAIIDHAAIFSCNVRRLHPFPGATADIAFHKKRNPQPHQDTV